MKSRLGFFLLLITLLSTSANAEPDPAAWYAGFSITPGVTFRHLGIKVIRKQDNYFGNISNQAIVSPAFSLNINSPQINLTRGGGIALQLQTYTSFISLDHQFIADDPGVTASSEGNMGTRIDVGTSLDGYYSYIVPAIKFESTLSGLGTLSASLGIGIWSTRFSGNIILTPNEQPATGLPADNIRFSANDVQAYMFSLSYRTTGNWLWMMTGGGTRFADASYKYKAEEVSLIVGKQFIF